MVSPALDKVLLCLLDVLGQDHRVESIDLLRHLHPSFDPYQRVMVVLEAEQDEMEQLPIFSLEKSLVVEENVFDAVFDHQRVHFLATVTLLPDVDGDESTQEVV